MKGLKTFLVLATAMPCFWALGTEDKSHLDYRTQIGKKGDRLGKLLPIFQVVRFPNDPCEIAGGAKNGTCYTDEECTNLGGTNGGTCASGFGVCCIITLTCGSTTAENCTYFEVTNAPAGACRAKICRANDNICSIRLDMTNFAITGPNTITTSSFKLLNGQTAAPAGKAASQSTRCLTDKFTISNQFTVPEVCGDLSGEHIYFEASSDCNSLDFELGSQVVGVTSFATRTWSIKVTQISCTDPNLPPQGCDQYYTGTVGRIQSFNFGSSNRHLANQHQNICFRREMNYCLICFTATAAIDVSTGNFKTNVIQGAIAGSICCGYGDDGSNTNTGGYDCIVVPGAVNAANTARYPHSQCANKVGLVTAAAANLAAGHKTICSTSYPFRFEFFSDAFEQSGAILESTVATSYNHGFRVTYFQTACP